MLLDNDTNLLDFSKVDKDTKKEIIAMHHRLRHWRNKESEKDNLTKLSSIDPKELNKNITDRFERIKKLEQMAENKPKSWLAKKIQWLKDLYAKWKQKADEEHDQNKIGFFKNILRLITHYIDYLLKKLQSASDWIASKF